MNLKNYLFFILAAIAMASCSTGKYYANKRINHHYEAEAPTLPVTTKQTAEKYAAPADNAVAVLPQKTNATNHVPLIPPKSVDEEIMKVDLKPGNYTLPAPIVTGQATKPANHESVNVQPALKSLVKPVSAAKEGGGVGRFLLYVLVALLCVVLAVVFLGLFGEFGVIFFIIFMIAAVLLCIAGIIALF